MFRIMGDFRDFRDVDEVGVTVILIDNNGTPILLLYTSI
jgi:hypothetical protein